MSDVVLGILSGLTGLAGGIGQIVSGSQEQAAAAANLDLQRQQLDYQKRVQGETWRREDTAVARRVADLRAAGLSPVLAAGSAAQSSPAQVLQAPQQDVRAAGATARGVAGGAQSALATMSTFLALNQAKAQIDRTEAETKLIEAQARMAEARTPWADRLAGLEFQTRESEAVTATEKSRIAVVERSVQEALFSSGQLTQREAARTAREVSESLLAGHEERAYNMLRAAGVAGEFLRILSMFLGRR